MPRALPASSEPFVWPRIEPGVVHDKYEQELWDPKSPLQLDSVDVVPVSQHRKRRFRTRRRPMFVYLMASADAPYIGLASDPMYRVVCHNRLLPSGAKPTRSGRPNWRAQLIIGPFYRGAARFKREWSNDSRRLEPRIAHGVGKALEYWDRGLQIYARDPAYVWRVYRERQKDRHPHRRHTRARKKNYKPGCINVQTTVCTELHTQHNV